MTVGAPIDFRYIEVNGAWEKMTGIPNENATGRLISFRLSTVALAPGMVDGPRFRDKVCADMAERLGISLDEAMQRLLAYDRRRYWLVNGWSVRFRIGQVAEDDSQVAR